jgi:hypothetical protein
VRSWRVFCGQLDVLNKPDIFQDLQLLRELNCEWESCVGNITIQTVSMEGEPLLSEVERIVDRLFQKHLIRDCDGAYGAAFIRRIRAMGIRDRPVSARSHWQNGYAERLIGSILECHRRWRAPRSRIVPKILQRGQNAPIAAEGRAGSA